MPDEMRLGSFRDSSGAITLRDRPVCVRQFHLLTPFLDVQWHEIARRLGVRWDRTRPYLVIRYQQSQEGTDATGRLKLTFDRSFAAESFRDFPSADRTYIAWSKSHGNKDRTRLTVDNRRKPVAIRPVRL